MSAPLIGIEAHPLREVRWQTLHACGRRNCPVEGIECQQRNSTLADL